MVLNDFFIFSHLHYTSHMGDFVIASEFAIAKGIRRIVALTGPKAQKATKKAELLQNQINSLEQLMSKKDSDSKECVMQIVELTNDISAAVIPSWRKASRIFDGI